MSQLNPEQEKAVKSCKGPMIILAGAGTGKTRVITHRIAELIRQEVSPYKIAAMTFTNKAAREMKERLEKLLGRRNSQKLWVGTFHSFCLKILRIYSSSIGLSRKFSLLSMSDQLSLVKKSCEELLLLEDYQASYLLEKISQCKNMLLKPSQLDFAKHEKNFGLDEKTFSDLKDVYTVYEKLSLLHQVIDFDDCILKTVYLIKENSEIKEELREKIRYFLVDEFQDTNKSQFELLKELAGLHQNICVVGDDDQSIYGWRGALPEILSLFEKSFSGTKLIKLEQNYRSSSKILKLANQVIKKNTERKNKNLWTPKSGGEPVYLKTFRTLADEAEWIATKISSLLATGSKLSDIAVLYRTNAMAKHIEPFIREKNLSYKIYGGQSFLERKEIQDLIAYLQIISDPKNNLAFFKIVNTPTRGLGLKTQELIADYMKKSLKSAFRSLEDLVKLQALNEKASKQAHLFCQKITNLAKKTYSSEDSLAKLVETIIEDFSLADYIKQTEKKETSRNNKLKNMYSLLTTIKRLSSSLAKRGETLTLDTLVDILSLDNSLITDLNAEKKEEKVSLMSIHAAKGLEFPIVFLCGLTDGVLPHHENTVSTRLLEEERRHFYVAITRAKEVLFLSYSELKPVGKRKDPLTPSRFLEEVKKEAGLICEERLNVDHFEQKKEKTLDKLKKLKLFFKEKNT